MAQASGYPESSYHRASVKMKGCFAQVLQAVTVMENSANWIRWREARWDKKKTSVQVNHSYPDLGSILPSNLPQHYL